MIPLKDLILLFGFTLLFLIVIGSIRIGLALFDAFLERLFGHGPKDYFKLKYLYRRKRYLMSRPEQACFHALMAGVGQEFYIFPQVHLDALLDHRVRNGQDWRGAWRHISQKSVDFVLCDQQLSPVLAIELDDWSHDRQDRIARDRLVEALFASIGLPLLRLRPNGQAIDAAQLVQLVREKLAA